MNKYPYKQVDINTWKRKQHFEYFLSCDEPFHGLMAELDFTIGKQHCDTHAYKYFDYYLFHYMQALQANEAMRLRIVDSEVWCFDQIDSGITIMHEDSTFAYGSIAAHENFQAFCIALEQEKQRVKSRVSLHDPERRIDLIHFSVIPWLHFTGLSHARRFNQADSIPKVTFGKISQKKETFTMPISVHVHHALVDGKDVCDFINDLQNRLNHV